MKRQKSGAMGKKKVRQITGSSIGITFTKEDQEFWGIKVGDFIDCRDITIIKGEQT